MPGTHDLILFIAAGLLLNVTPGADTLYIVSRSTAQGAGAGAVAALGIGAGCIVHVVAAAAGLSALLAASATAFSTLKYVGAAYLLYLGATMLFASAGRQPLPAMVPGTSLARVFLGGVLTNVLNPKVALFFLAFLPQFIAPDAQAKWKSMLLLGLVFDLNGTLWNLVVAWSSARLSGRFARRPALSRWLRRLCGGVFVWFCIRLARSEA